MMWIALLHSSRCRRASAWRGSGAAWNAGIVAMRQNKEIGKLLKTKKDEFISNSKKQLVYINFVQKVVSGEVNNLSSLSAVNASTVTTLAPISLGVRPSFARPKGGRSSLQGRIPQSRHRNER